MKYERLRQICKKQRKFANLNTVFSIPIFIIFVIAMLNILFNGFENCVLLVTLSFISFGCVIFVTVFNHKEGKYALMVEDYVIIKIMNLINESGISTDDFEIVKVDESYRVGFHNQTVDYEDLQSKIDRELKVMNKIARRNIRIKLI